MKDIFTLCIAVILFGLCLIEKESRKKALDSAIDGQNSADITEISLNQDPNKSSLMKSDGISLNKPMSGQRAVSAIYPLFVQETSFQSFSKVR